MPLNPGKRVSLGTWIAFKSHTKEHAGMFARERQSSHSLLNDWVRETSRRFFWDPIERPIIKRDTNNETKTKNNIILYALQ